MTGGISLAEALHVCGEFSVGFEGSGGSPSVTRAKGRSSWRILSGGELGVSLLAGYLFQVGGSCCRNIVVRYLLCGGVDGLAAAPRSPRRTVLVGRHFNWSQSRGGAVAVGMGAGGNGCPGMGSEVVRTSMGLDAASPVGSKYVPGRLPLP